MNLVSILPSVIALVSFLIAMKAYKNFGLALCFAAVLGYITSSVENEFNERQVNKVLAEISKQGDVGAFAANNYKDCAHPTGFFVKNGNPVECKASVITLAASYRDQVFAKDVSKKLESIKQ